MPNLHPELYNPTEDREAMRSKKMRSTASIRVMAMAEGSTGKPKMNIFFNRAGENEKWPKRMASGSATTNVKVEEIRLAQKMPVTPC